MLPQAQLHPAKIPATTYSPVSLADQLLNSKQNSLDFWQIAAQSRLAVYKKYSIVDFLISEATICRFGSYFIRSVSGSIKMSSDSGKSKLMILFHASRPQFLVASAAPVLVGSCLGYAAVGSFNWPLFILALLGIMAIHSGANMANDYFDHLSGNDWANKNPTPFSGGSRYIQKGILSPKAILLTALLALAVGSAMGVVIVILTESPFILILGLVGLLGGFFYTAPPVKLGYRYIGEFIIALLFGVFPVYGSYYLQTGMIDIVPLLPSLIVGILIFLVILINEFPDLKADAAVDKKTLVVHFGVPASAWIYRTALVASFIIAAAAMIIYSSMFFAGLLYLITLPIAVLAIKSANKKDLATPGQYRASQITVLFHAVGSLTLTLGFIITALRNPPL